MANTVDQNWQTCHSHHYRWQISINIKPVFLKGHITLNMSSASFYASRWPWASKFQCTLSKNVEIIYPTNFCGTDHLTSSVVTPIYPFKLLLQGLQKSKCLANFGDFYMWETFILQFDWFSSSLSDFLSAWKILSVWRNFQDKIPDTSRSLLYENISSYKKDFFQMLKSLLLTKI